MIRLRHKLLIHFLRLFDQVCILVALLLVARLPISRETASAAGMGGPYTLDSVVAILVLAAGSVFLLDHFVRYDCSRFIALPTQLLGLLKGVTATAFLVLIATVTLGFPAFTGAHVILFWASTTAVLVVSRLLVRRLLIYSRRSGRTARQLLIVGFNERSIALADRFERCPELGVRILGFISEHDDAATDRAGREPCGSRTICGHMADVKRYLEHTVVDEMLICLPLEEQFGAALQAARLGEELGIVVRVVPYAGDARLLGRMQLESFEGQVVVTFFRETLLFQLMLKRLMDMAVSAILLAVLAPLLLAVALLIKLGSPGPVLFVQERVGMNRRRFNLYKFRSMAADAEIRKLEFAHLNEMDGPVFKIGNDPRVTPFGRLIRKTSIDELPQLFNVLTGSMSLVGPRPPIPSEVDKYDWLFQRRLSIKPGITCLWQIAGRNKVPFRKWMELDKEYVQHWSLWLDIKILLRTIPVVLRGNGAS